MKWEQEHLEYLKKNYASGHMGAMCTFLGRTTEAIHKKAAHMNLRRVSGNLFADGMSRGLNGSVLDFNKSTGMRGHVLPLKPLNLKGKKTVRIDRRTWVYMKPGQTKEDVILKYSRPSMAAAF